MPTAMKKTTKFSRKRRGGGERINLGFIHVINNSRGYTSELMPGFEMAGSTAQTLLKAEMEIRSAAVDLMEHRRPLNPDQSFDILSDALGVAVIRALEIEGNEEKNPLLPILMAGSLALGRSIERFNRSGAWGMDAAGKPDLAAAVDVFEEIIRNSTPAQMINARRERERVITKMYEESKARQQKEKATC